MSVSAANGSGLLRAMESLRMTDVANTTPCVVEGANRKLTTGDPHEEFVPVHRGSGGPVSGLCGAARTCGRECGRSADGRCEWRLAIQCRNTGRLPCGDDVRSSERQGDQWSL